jgi:hypothetical protein
MQALNWGALHPRWAGKRIKRRSDFSWLRHVQSNQVPGGCSKLAKKRDTLHCDPLGVTVVLVASEPIANFLRSCYQTRTKKILGETQKPAGFWSHQRQRVLTLTWAYQHPPLPWVWGCYHTVIHIPNYACFSAIGGTSTRLRQIT